MKKILVRPSRPSAVSLAFALAVTMLAVFICVKGAGLSKDAPVDAPAQGMATIPIEAMQACFEICAGFDSPEEAAVAAAQCHAGGGAGVIVENDGKYCVACSAYADESAFSRRAHTGAESLTAQCGSLALKCSGSAAEITAVARAVDFLRTQAGQTGSLAASIESGGTDASSMQALLSVFLTQGRSARAALASYARDEAAQRILTSLESALLRLETAFGTPSPANLRRIYAAGRLEWIRLANDLCRT